MQIASLLLDNRRNATGIEGPTAESVSTLTSGCSAELLKPIGQALLRAGPFRLTTNFTNYMSPGSTYNRSGTRLRLT